MIEDGVLYFSKSLPWYEHVFSTQDNTESYTLSIYRGDETEESALVAKLEDLVAFRNLINEIKISDLIHAAMRVYGDNFSEFTIEDSTEYGPKKFTNFRVFRYSGVVSEDAEKFMTSNFAIDFPTKVIGDDEKIHINIYYPESDSSETELQALLYFEKSFAPMGLVIDDGQNIASKKFTNIVTSARELIDIAERDRLTVDGKSPSELGRLQSILFMCGNRRLKVYYAFNRYPAASLTFRNTFGMEEAVSIFGSWKFKSDAESKTANVAGKRTPYDETFTPELEISAEPMHMMDAAGWKDFLPEGKVSVRLFAGNKDLVIDAIVTKAELKMTSKAYEQQSVKITLVPELSDVAAIFKMEEYSRFNQNFNNRFI